jgi:hypothetical protein
MAAIKAWAEYATTPATNHPFNKANYQKFRKYYISELNRLALGRGNEWKSGGVRLSEFFRRQKNKAMNFRKRSAENFRRAKQAAENAKRATAKAASLKALNAKQLFNSSRARVTAFGFRKAGNAVTERSKVLGEIEKLKTKAAALRQQSKALNAAGNAAAAAAAAAQANAAAAAATTLAASTSASGPNNNSNNENYFNAPENFEYTAEEMALTNTIQDTSINTNSTQFKNAVSRLRSLGFLFQNKNNPRIYKVRKNNSRMAKLVQQARAVGLPVTGNTRARQLWRTASTKI